MSARARLHYNFLIPQCGGGGFSRRDETLAKNHKHNDSGDGLGAVGGGGGSAKKSRICIGISGRCICTFLCTGAKPTKIINSNGRALRFFHRAKKSARVVLPTTPIRSEPIQRAQSKCNYMRMPLARTHARTLDHDPHCEPCTKVWC